MKLTFSRSKGYWPEGIQFELLCRLELTPEEDQLFQTYRPPEHILEFLLEAEIPPGEHAFILSFVEPDVEDALNREDTIKQSCEDLLAYLKKAEAYGGQAVYEL